MKILGISFVVGGTRVVEFQFSSMIAQTLSSFMFVATSALILPTAFEAGLPQNATTQAGALALSRGTSIVILAIYILFLVYQLETHSYVFETEDRSLAVDNVEDGAHEKVLDARITASTILVVTVAVSFCSDYLVDSIDDVVKSFGLSKTFIGLILVPIVGNAGISTIT
jgi:Ca2+:H+ antiporter